MSVPRAGRFSNYVVGPWLTTLAGMSLYATLFTVDPYTVQNPSTVEVVGGSFARQPVAFTVSGRLMTSTASLYFQGIPAGTSVSTIGVMDAAFNGNLMWAGPIPNSPVTYISQGYLTIAPGDYLVGIDA